MSLSFSDPLYEWKLSLQPSELCDFLQSETANFECRYAMNGSEYAHRNHRRISTEQCYSITSKHSVTYGVTDRSLEILMCFILIIRAERVTLPQAWRNCSESRYRRISQQTGTDRGSVWYIMVNKRLKACRWGATKMDRTKNGFLFHIIISSSTASHDFVLWFGLMTPRIFSFSRWNILFDFPLYAPRDEMLCFEVFFFRAEKATPNVREGWD